MFYNVVLSEISWRHWNEECWAQSCISEENIYREKQRISNEIICQGEQNKTKKYHARSKQIIKFSDFLFSSSEWKYRHCCTSWASSPEYFSKWPVTNCIRVTPSLMAHRDCDVSGKSQHNMAFHKYFVKVCYSIWITDWSGVLSSSASSDRWKECFLQKSDVCRGSQADAITPAI